MQNNIKQEQGFIKLKNIHDIQVGGEIGSLLKSLRDMRTVAEECARILSARKKEFTKDSKPASEKGSMAKDDQLSESKISEANNTVEYGNSASAVESSISDFKEKNLEMQAQKSGEKDFTSKKTFDTRQNFGGRNNFDRKFDGKSGGYRTFGQNQQGQNRPFVQRDGRHQLSGQNTGKWHQQGQGFNSNSNFKGPFNGRSQPNGGQRQFARPNQFGGNQKPFANGFASSKTNNFRNFEIKESIDVLAQPERNVGNKNKNINKTLDEKKQQTFVKRPSIRNNIIIEDDDGFSETTMGSRKLVRKKKELKTFVANQIENAVITTDSITVKMLSEKTGRPVVEIIKKLMLLGVMATINTEIDFETAELALSELGVTLEKKVEKSYEEKLIEAVEEVSDEKNLKKRPPVVAVMGHVDHGKTSLLDAIRKTNVVTAEAGGITQRIGAYQVTHNGEKITFIDTPGHAAFTAMRARGAEATDIAVLVVAADDGVMPQTVEAIQHIKAAKVPMIVAINKIDKPTANIDRIKQQLAENDVLPEEWGGDAILVPVSAKTGKNIDELLSMILLCSEVLDLKADNEKLASGVVLESTLDKNKGPIATILVQNGTLKVGDNIISGLAFGKIKAMFDENGKTVKSATPSTPVSVMGFDCVPSAGDKVAAIDEKLSKKVIEERKSKLKEEQTKSTSGVSLDNFMTRVNEDKLKSLNIIIKADVHGSIEALRSSLCEIKNDEAHVVCIYSGVGAVTESDVLLASASGAVIIAFDVKPQPKAKQLAEQMRVEIKEYNIIYQVIDDLTLAINGMLTPKYEEKYSGTAEIRMVFKLSSGTIAGCYVTDGKILRNAVAHLMRGNEEIAVTTIEALKIQKDDKAEISYGYECGIKLKDCTSFKEDDRIVVYIKERIN